MLTLMRNVKPFFPPAIQFSGESRPSIPDSWTS
jgi:hypothetical protein